MKKVEILNTILVLASRYDPNTYTTITFCHGNTESTENIA